MSSQRMLLMIRANTKGGRMGWVRVVFGLWMPFLLLVTASNNLGASPFQDDGAPINVTLAGGAAQGMFAVLGEAVTEAVRRQNPGSALVYEPGNNAGSLLRMLRGDVSLSMYAAGELNAALKGEAPFPRAYA